MISLLENRVTRVTRVALAVSAAGVVACGGTDTTAPAPGPGNAAPVARAGADLVVSATLPIGLDGSASSDGDGDALTYAWSFAATPSGSGAALDDATSATPAFTPDLPGEYRLALVVSDGTDESAPDEAVVTAEDNTVTETVGASGGQVTSADGSVVLDVPAGALGGDEEISLTLVPPLQRSGDLADLGPAAIVYEMRPDGLTFSAPVEVTVELPGVSPPSSSGGDFSAPLWATATLSGGVWELAGQSRTSVDVETGTGSAAAQIDHFSWMVIDRVRIEAGTQAGQSLLVRADPPSEAYLHTPFPVGVDVHGDFASNVAQGTVSASVADASSLPVAVDPPFDGTLVQAQGTSLLDLVSTNDWECKSVAYGVWAVDVSITVSDLYFGSVAVPVAGSAPLQATLEHEVRCVEVVIAYGPYQELAIPAPEGLAFARPGTRPLALYARSLGATVTDIEGRPTMELVATGSSTVTTYNVTGEEANGALSAGNDGVRAYFGPLQGTYDPGAPSTPVYDLDVYVVSAPAPSGPSGSGPLRMPDFTAHATDVFTFGGGTTDVGAAAVLFGDKNLAFFQTGTSQGGAPGWVLDQSLAEAFRDGNGSVFGGTSPVSAYVGPNGFDESNPMLVVTIDDGIQVSELWKVDLVAGKAQLTLVPNVTPADEARSVRCLAGICALSAYGSPFGFGSTTLFQWDGQDAFSVITGIAGRTIGIDLIETDRNSVLIATTSFQSDAYTVYEVALNGQFVGSAFESVPAGCTGPGHILFRSMDEVLISCNTSDNVVSDDSFTIS